MDSKKLYSLLLELEPEWEVREVRLDQPGNRVNVCLEYEKTDTSRCPQCGLPCPVIDRSAVKTVRHFDSCNIPTYIKFSIPVALCENHGRIPIHPALATADGEFTIPFKKYLKEGIQRSGIGFICKAHGIERSQALEIMQKSRMEEYPVRKPPKRPEEGSVTPDGQLSLFDMDKMILNKALLELKQLNLEKAHTLFTKYAAQFPQTDRVEKQHKLTKFILKALYKIPDTCPENINYLLEFWQEVYDYGENSEYAVQTLISEIKPAYFRRILEAIEGWDQTAPTTLFGPHPMGYVYLQTGDYDRSIRSLQEYIKEDPHNARIFGFLGDAYFLRGEKDVGRQCYQEAFLIEPADVDWAHFKDETILDLKNRLIEEYGMDPGDAIAWLPSHAMVEGLLPKKMVSITGGLKELIDDYRKLMTQLRKKRIRD